MAGHFVLWRIHPQDAADIFLNFPGSAFSPLQHAAGAAIGPGGGVFPGWTPASRALLNSVKEGRSNMVNRNGLPPHKYVMFPPGAPNPAQVAFLRGVYWVNDLYRPTDTGFGLTALSLAAAAEWNNNRKVDALVAQITNGATSLEVYYVGSSEVN